MRTKRHQSTPPKPQKVCAYCNLREDCELQHIIPKSLFSQKPIRTLTIRACTPCNHGRGDGGPHDLSLDETYLHHILTTHAPTLENPNPNQILTPPIIPPAEPTTTKNKPLLHENPSPFDLPALPVEWPRIHRVIRKIVRGLYYAHGREPLPTTHDVLYTPTLNNTDFRSMENTLAGNLLLKPFLIGEDNTFTYAHCRHPTDARSTAWLLLLHGYLGILAHTAPKNSIPQTISPHHTPLYPAPTDQSQISASKSY